MYLNYIRVDLKSFNCYLLLLFIGIVVSSIKSGRNDMYSRILEKFTRVKVKHADKLTVFHYQCAALKS